MRPSAQAFKKAGIVTAVVLVIAVLGVQTALLWELRSTEVEVLNPVEEVTVANPEVTILNTVDEVTVSNPVEEVTVLNPVDRVTVLNPEVTVLNPVTEVGVANPVRSVSVLGSVNVSQIDSLVQTGTPWIGAELYGYCSLRGSRYEVSVKALAGGVEHLVVAGSYSGDITSLIGEYVSQYYHGFSNIGLDFGDSSEDCSGLEGWQ